MLAGHRLVVVPSSARGLFLLVDLSQKKGIWESRIVFIPIIFKGLDKIIETEIECIDHLST
jgi:hypothetical protein